MMNKIKKIEKYIKKNNLKNLLPQNIPVDIFSILLNEATSLSTEDKTARIGSILLVVFALKSNNNKFMNKQSELQFNEEELRENISLYCTALQLEDMRRQKTAEIADTSLPTLENIFNKTKKLNIKWL